MGVAYGFQHSQLYYHEVEGERHVKGSERLVFDLVARRLNFTPVYVQHRRIVICK